jgi:4-diphosphocytidyl-2-C-methyl-D-erythritol kinase
VAATLKPSAENCVERKLLPQALFDCPAPAKLNLFLHIIGRREDGYHLLQTVFQLVDHGDMLDFQVRGDGKIVRQKQIPGVAEDHDLTVRAARILQAEIANRRGGLIPGADITVHKKLPMGGGLGGGSSDAATTLIVLNHLWNGGLKRDELVKMGLQLGADVPVFVFGRTAFGEGVGDKLTTIVTPPSWYVVIEPGVPVATAAIFDAPQLTRNTKAVKIADFSESTSLFGKNDLQAVVAGVYAEVAAALEALGKFGEARLTGSGSCVFARFDDEKVAEYAVVCLKPGWKVWKAKAIQQHPLYGLAE